MQSAVGSVLSVTPGAGDSTSALADVARGIFLGKMKSSFRAVAIMVFVVLFMAAGAKFTLNRKTRDFMKWVSEGGSEKLCEGWMMRGRDYAREGECDGRRMPGNVNVIACTLEAGRMFRDGWMEGVLFMAAGARVCAAILASSVVLSCLANRYSIYVTLSVSRAS